MTLPSAHFLPAPATEKQRPETRSSETISSSNSDSIRDVVRVSEGVFRLQFRDRDTAFKFVLALSSLVSGVIEAFNCTDRNGRRHDDLEFAEVRQHVLADRLGLIAFSIAAAPEVRLTIAVPDADSTTIAISAPSVTGAATATQWLQAHPEYFPPLPLLGVPLVGSAGLNVDSFHPLVALASRTGVWESASLEIADHASWTWSPTALSGAQPVTPHLDGALWRASGDGHGDTAVAWFAGAVVSEPALPFAPEWIERLRALLAEPNTLHAIEEHLKAAPLALPSFRVAALEVPPAGRFAVPPETDVALTLTPSDDAVVVALDLSRGVRDLEELVLHAVAHLALGHVAPGDEWGHWDTAETASSRDPHREWDRDAAEYRNRIAPRPARRIESLADCTPREKAQLGLWRMIGEMLGESRSLHPKAMRYQRAAYQRQGAERLVSMLEQYGGAMLCDGVGLGKTYVATTSIVHYVNEWRDRFTAGDDFLQDPFRVTVIAPHSVVSTWRREALPGLAAFGVPLATVRVISHSALSKVVATSAVLQPARDGLSDLEHLLLSDYVIVDEAHNFRSIGARRTKVLRDLLRLQPRKERRKVLLLTATPINNSLDDLKQQLSLLFSKSLALTDAKTDDGYRRQAIATVRERCARARSARSSGDAYPLVIHNRADAAFADAIEFRDDLNFGPNVQRIGDYLREQDKQLRELQDSIRSAAQNGAVQPATARVRIAEDLLDRIVVQRSRGLCKEIERQHASTVALLFRPDAGAPERLRYSDEYDGIPDVLAQFLPLFDDPSQASRKPVRPLSLKVYMWYDVREGLKSAADTSSVVGLQRVLALKRLESSPVSFLVTLLRLTVLHARRLQDLRELSIRAGDRHRTADIAEILDHVVSEQPKGALTKIRSLVTGTASPEPRKGFVEALANAYVGGAASDTDDPPPQLHLYEDDSTLPERQSLDRLWPLSEYLVQDFETLLRVTPRLTEIVFGRFQQDEWPHRFIAGGDAIDWPRAPAWAQRIVTDAKLRRLVERLLIARAEGQKVVVFSQFSDTIAYIRSVLDACRSLDSSDWRVIAPALNRKNIREELPALIERVETITGSTADRDEIVNAFAPWYRIGPNPPTAMGEHDADQRALRESWEVSWTGAIEKPIDILFATDVLAEGVNLQDAALLVNYDVHWNPVRMIQRAGRIDRRLNAAIENERDFPELEALASSLGRTVPPYYWHDRTDEGPVTVNMILPDELEEELLLRERIAIKTLAIDVTLGLEHGTGAEADWMASYKYRGIASLNSIQRDRAIEQISGHHERLTAAFRDSGIDPSWADELNGWFRASDASDAEPLIGRIRLGRRGSDLTTYSRYLEPLTADNHRWWLWSQSKPARSILNFWICLDGNTWPPRTRMNLEWTETQSVPIGAHHLLAAAEHLQSFEVHELPPQLVGRPLRQGATAFAAGFLGSEDDRRTIQIRQFFILQLPTFTRSMRSDTTE